MLGQSTVFGAGIGVFAVNGMEEGERLEILGVRIRAESVTDQCTAFADFHKFRIEDWLVIPFGFGGMVNHSDTPNLLKELDGDKIFFKALRKIVPGEELFHAYNEKAKGRMGLA